MLVLLTTYFYYVPELPKTKEINTIKLQTPLRIYTIDKQLIAEFGEQRRNPVHYDSIPKHLINAFLAAEDDRFFSHPGVDYHGILRAAKGLILSKGRIRQGGSTITMQLTKNFFFSSEKKFSRKLKEILLSLKIEREFSKQKILSLYLNKIFLGHRAYGIASAADVYYGKPLAHLNIAQMAMIAGLPKAPSSYNPITKPSRALIRRDHILNRMLKLKYISPKQYLNAIDQPITAQLHKLQTDISAPYIAEMVRAKMLAKYGKSAYTRGLNVYTTIESKLQTAAQFALKDNLLRYDKRHGYRGPIENASLQNSPTTHNLYPAIVAKINAKEAEIILKSGKKIVFTLANVRWAKRYLSVNKKAKKPTAIHYVLKQNEIIYVQNNCTYELIRISDSTKKDALITAYKADYMSQQACKFFILNLITNSTSTWTLAGYHRNKQFIITPIIEPKIISLFNEQDTNRHAITENIAPILGQQAWILSQFPKVQGAIVSISANTGAVKALSGGFDYYSNKFNRATQLQRQPGSGFKPMIYSAALEKGFSAASIINDAPILDNNDIEWRPQNYNHDYTGPTRLRKALIHSKNLVSIRILRKIGIDYAIEYAQRFGFNSKKLPHGLSLSLGTGVTSPYQMAGAFSPFANGGYKVEPYWIEQITDNDGHSIFQATPLTVCKTCDDLQKITKNPAPQVITSQNSFIMNSILRDVIQRGTGRKAKILKRRDIGGKTGTTNEQRDAWFYGFSPEIVTVTWVGFDQLKSLGKGETGSKAALPIWIDYMHKALQNYPEKPIPLPSGITKIRIDPATGLQVSAKNKNSIFEYFRVNNLPESSKERVNNQDIFANPSQIF